MNGKGIDKAIEAHTRQGDIIKSILAERYEQDSEWGEQNHTDLYWLGILMEEVGEVAKALIESSNPIAFNIDEEMIQSAAIILNWLECRKRRAEKLNS